MTSWPRIAAIAREVNLGKTRALGLTEKALAEIDEQSKYQAIISTTKERAIQRAKEIDERVKNKQPAGRLAGVPFIAKDNFLVFGAETTAASNILKGFKPPYQATVIERLEAEGAICIAKANLDAFAHGTSTENSDFFTTSNPKDKTRVAGGSSGGSAAAVALGIVPFALGTDTGGSIRLPASFCGVVGYKPTYGAVSRSGVVAMASSTDTVGALTSNVEDLALVMEIISGKDPLDATTIELKDGQFSSFKAPKKAPTIGVIKEYFEEGLHDDVKASILSAIEDLKSAGATVKDVSLPSLPLALATYYVLCPAEVASNLSRYDGQRYGYSDKEAKSLDDSYLGSRSKGFGAEAKRRIMIGSYVLSSGYYDAYYKRAQTVRTKLITEFELAFRSFDYLVGPTSATTAFKIGEYINDPLSMYLNDIMTVAANLVGNPAIVLPAKEATGLPVGLQLMAASTQDFSLINYAKYLEDKLNV